MTFLVGFSLSLAVLAVYLLIQLDDRLREIQRSIEDRDI